MAQGVQKSFSALEFKLNPPESINVEQTKRQGNLDFLAGRLNPAIQAYSAILEVNPNDSDVLSHRGASYIRVKAYEKAKIDLFKSLNLEKKLRGTESVNIKTIYRWSQAMWGLKQYNQTVSYLEEIINETNDGKIKEKIQALIEVSKKQKLESETGEYDMPILIKKTLQNYPCGEYVGPIKVQKVSGKGRGIVATSDILAGETVLGCKAFAIIMTSPDSKTLLGLGKQTSEPETVSESGDAKEVKVDELVNVIKDMFIANPNAAKEFYKLYAGPKLNYLDGNEEMENVVDEERIVQICYYNRFFCALNPNPKNIPRPEDVDEIRHSNASGIWLLPSYFNHSCIDINCDVQKYGDFIIARALRKIKKGEELSWTYSYPTKFYNERKSEIDSYGFKCSCKLCEIDQADPQIVHENREELTTLFVEASLRNSSNVIKVIEAIKKNLELLRPKNPELNWSLFWVYRELGNIYTSNNMYKLVKSAECLEAAYRYSKYSCFKREGIRFVFQICMCYITAKMKKEARKWIKIMIEDIKIAYGTLDVLPMIAIREQLSYDKLVDYFQQLGFGSIIRNIEITVVKNGQTALGFDYNGLPR